MKRARPLTGGSSRRNETGAAFDGRKQQEEECRGRGQREQENKR